MRVIGVIFLWALIAPRARPQVENRAKADYSIVADIPYCSGNGKSLLMDVFVPRARVRQPTPAILWLHGGGWERGDKNGSSGAEFLAAAGFVTASIYYRLSGEAKFPADIEDCKCAVRFLRANAAKYGLDPYHIGVAGASAGAHLALLAGMADEKAGLEGSGGWPNASSRVSAVVAYYGPTDLTAIGSDFGARAQAAIIKLIGAAPRENLAAYRRASPLTYVGPGKPPILMVHGDGDTLVPFEQSKRMLDACVRAGIEAKLITVENANHDFALVDPRRPLSISIDQIHTATIEFFKKQLVR